MMTEVLPGEATEVSLFQFQAMPAKHGLKQDGKWMLK
jgi:hypothetical protein